MKVLSLFSGVGMIDLGLQRCGMNVVGQVEIDPFCLSVLEKHWPNAHRHNDVQTRKFAKGEADVICAGFPCQDISNAGLRAGIAGERSRLYREVVRALRVVRPIGALLENVAALLARGMGTVLGDLAEIGYDTEWDCVPASSCGALHHRDRVFIRAVPANSVGMRPQRLRTPAKGPWSWEQFERLVQAEIRLSVPAGTSGGISDGLPRRMVRLRAAGNAVVPQVIEEIGRSLQAQLGALA